jgi:hypothetical protein
MNFIWNLDDYPNQDFLKHFELLKSQLYNKQKSCTTGERGTMITRNNWSDVIYRPIGFNYAETFTRPALECSDHDFINI